MIDTMLTDKNTTNCLPDVHNNFIILDGSNFNGQYRFGYIAKMDGCNEKWVGSCLCSIQPLDMDPQVSRGRVSN